RLCGKRRGERGSRFAPRRLPRAPLLQAHLAPTTLQLNGPSPAQRLRARPAQPGDLPWSCPGLALVLPWPCPGLVLALHGVQLGRESGTRRGRCDDCTALRDPWSGPVCGALTDGAAALRCERTFALGAGRCARPRRLSGPLSSPPARSPARSLARSLASTMS